MPYYRMDCRRGNFYKCLHMIHSSIFNRDYPVIQTYVLLIGVLFVVFNLLFDILQTVSDPRMRKEGN